MSIADSMTARIKAAAAAKTIPPSPKDRFDCQVSDFHTWLSTHTAVAIKKQACLEDVSLFSRYDWSDDDLDAFPGFEFKTIMGSDQKTDLVAGLKTRGAEGDDMPWEFWIDKHGSPGNGNMLIAVFKSGDDIPVGFACWNSDVFIESLADDATSFENQSHSLMFELNLESVYVAPDMRGLGFGSALRWAVVEQAMDTITKIAEIPEEKIVEIGRPDLRVFYSGEARSTEGALVASSIAESIQTIIDMGCRLEAPWFGDIQIEDDFDYDNYLDRACSLPDPVARIG